MFLTLAALLVIGGNGLFAQTTKDVTLTVSLSAWYNLTIGAAAVSFADESPATFDAAPANKTIAGSPANVNVAAFAVCAAGQTLKLTVKAGTDLTTGGGTPLTIGIGAITWTASGDAGYVGGAMTTAPAGASAGSWTGSILHYHTGTFNYSFLRNYTNQAPGTYTATATYTLSAI